MKKAFFLGTVFFSSIFSFAQNVEISTNQGTNGNSMLGSSNYAANECIYTESEIGASNFTTVGTAITHISYNVAVVGTNTTFSSVTIYMKDISSSVNNFTGSGVYDALNTYTQVFSGSVTLSSIGWKEIELTTPYVRTSGTNLKILIIRNDGAVHTNYVYYCSSGYGNLPTANTIRRYNSTAAVTGTTTLTQSALRQAIRLTHKFANDAKVNNIYTLGKLPIPHSASQTIKANVTNIGINTLNNLNVTLNVNGANSFSNTQTLTSLAPGTTTLVSFPAATFNNLGTNTVSVSVANDDDNTNNTSIQNQEVTNNSWTHALGTTMSAGFGFTNTTGDIANKFNTTLPSIISQVSMFFYTGGQNYKVGIWDASGANGTPGSLLWESALQTSIAGQNLLSVTPTVNISAGDFYVGIRQTGIVNVGLAYQSENPVRTQTFYYASPSGSASWYDFAPNGLYRFMIEPVLQQTCTSSPASAVSSGPSTICAGNAFTLTSVGFTVGTSISYQWESSPSGMNVWSPIVGATNIVHTVASQSGNIDYRLVTTCNTINSATPSNIVTVLETPFYNCYCSSTASNSTNEEIYSVTLNGDNSNSLSGQGNGCSTVAPGSGSVLSRYSNFKSLGALSTMKRGAVIPFTIVENECDGAPYNAFGTTLFVDYNHNGSFAEAGEQVFVENTATIGPRSITGSFIVPTSASIGLTGMRVVVAEGVSGAGLTPCLTYGYGETEDYLVNIVSCPFDTAIVSVTNASICAGNSVSFTATPKNNGITLAYQWLLNGNVVAGETNSSFTSSTLNNGEIVTVQALNTCGNTTVSSGITMNVTTPSSSSINATSCNSFTWNVNGQTYTNSGTYSFTTGCHTDVLNLTISQNTTTNYTATACDNYTWGINGQTYSSSGTYNSITGCHTDVLQLTITPSTSNVTTVSVCDSFTWNVSGMTYFTSGTYTVSAGCHSEVLNLTVNPTTTTTSNVTSCNSYTWAANGQTYTTSGVYTTTVDCHTETINLTISPITNNVTVITACNNYTWSVTGLTYTQTGIYTAYINCNIEVLDLTIPQNTIISDTVATCGNYTWLINGQNYAASGVYTSINGCITNQLVLTINQVPTISLGQNIQVCNGNSVILNATGAQNYSWNNGVVNNQPFIPAITQTYTVVGTDANGCADTESITVSVMPIPTINAGNNIAECFGTTITLNATSDASITWNNGVVNNQPFAAILSGTYIATATTAAGCTRIDSLEIAVLPLPQINAGQDLSVCAGNFVSLNATGGNNLTWSGGVVNNQYFMPLASATYIVTGVGNNGCINSDSVLVSVLSLPNVNAGNNVEVCQGNAVTLTATGALNYSWTGGITNGQSFNPTNSATYIVTGTDANGCVNKDTVLVTKHALPIALVSNTYKAICPGGNTSVTASGGTNYLWSNGSTTATTTFTQAGTYMVVATDSFGCSDVSDTVTVQVKPLPAIVVIANSTTGCEGNPIPLYLNPSINVTGFDVQWYSSGALLPGETNTTFYATTSGAYLLKVSGGSNCTNQSTTKTITVLPKPTATISTSGSPNICTGGKVVLIAGLPTTYTSYKWLKDGVAVTATVNYKVTIPGIYQLTVLKNGCSDTSDPVVVSVYPKPVPSIASLQAIICSGDSTQLNAAPLVAGYNYQWVLGQNLIANATNSNHFAKAPGNYKVIVTNTGCSGVSPLYKVTVNATPAPIISPQGPLTIALNGNVKLLATYYAGAIYQWYLNGNTIAGATKRDYKVTAGGDYSVSVTKNNCFGVAPPVTVIQSSIKLENANTNSIDESFEMLVYPNPVANVLKLNINGLDEVHAIIQIIDINGKLALTQQLNDLNSSIDVSNLSNGMYFLHFKDESGLTASLKFIKE